jgi:hypothetical protein
MTSSRQPGVVRLDASAVLGFILISLALINTSMCAPQISRNHNPDELRRLEQLEISIDQLKQNPINFYNYSIICGGKEFNSRVNMPHIDPSIPSQHRNMILDTYSDPATRPNKCPNWARVSNTDDTDTGAMEKLIIAENTAIGTRVFSLLATDPEMQPVHYFIRNVESVPADEPVVFKISPVKVGNNFYGEVTVSGQLDYEKKKSYQYLTYAYDGFNLIERYTSVQVTDLDDEVPAILTDSNARFNTATNRFEFAVFENISIGEIVNRDALIVFSDVDTQRSQLKVRLVNNGAESLPFAINNDGEIKLITNLDYENNKEYTFKLIIEVILFYN